LDKVRQGGGDRSLVLLDQVALVASARNNTVITAVPRGEAGDNVFTDIDSAVIV
jgi:flagellar operon protein